MPALPANSSQPAGSGIKAVAVAAEPHIAKPQRDGGVGRWRSATSDGVNIAYQVLGEGALDLLMVPGWVSNLDLFWEKPSFERFLRRLASFSRLVSRNS